MKKELSPKVVGVVIALIVLVLGVVFYRQVVVEPTSAHPQMHFNTSGKPNAPAPPG